MDFSKFRKNHENEYHELEHESPRVEETCKVSIQNVEEENIPEDHDMEKPQRPMETPHEMTSTKRRPNLDRDVNREVEIYGAP